MENNFKEKLNGINFNGLIKLTFTGKKRVTGILSKAKGAPCVQLEEIIGNKAFHENVEFNNIVQTLDGFLTEQPSNLNIICEGTTYDFKRTKKGAALFRSSKNDRTLKHEGKNYLLSPTIPPLFDLGVTTADGRIKNGMNAKFVQIERFTELVTDAVGGRKEIKIIDSGCGKAYLSFVLYHYLTRELKIETVMTGVDLKEDVIEILKKTADKYGFEKMNFIAGDIFNADFNGYDMLISLHACDKATDYALFNAVKNNVEIILAVPCCQHEINKKFESANFKILNRYGIIKERISALLTDALRASLLTYCGYKTQLIEFTDFGHSPKNIMIRAIKGGVSETARREALNECEKLLNEIGAGQELYRLIFNKREPQ